MIDEFLKKYGTTLVLCVLGGVGGGLAGPRLGFPSPPAPPAPVAIDPGKVVQIIKEVPVRVAPFPVVCPFCRNQYTVQPPTAGSKLGQVRGAEAPSK